MKLKLALLCGLLFSGANAMACYTVYDGNNRVVYRGTDAPVDMSLPLHQAVSQRFPAGSSLVFDQGANCTPVSLAQVARPTSGMIPPNTIRMERTGRTLSPSSDASPLLTDRETAQRNGLPHTVVGASNIVMVPAQAAARLDLPTYTVIPADTALARANVPAAPNTTAMGAGPAPARQQTVITEMRDPPMTIIQRGNNISVQR
ncbi:hypothetical protein [Ramlibacter pallidus]|uniref:Uncharacterized protein n=1 Tax=Ramlibacter pallidus TaxID=2780087 RepID=A0ABR9S8X1_9BURK|nr:hypothetical protein [Ramlibacter pallidus]MBE7369854.1 hypothetical protein [Ramlibacter pallidus]